MFTAAEMNRISNGTFEIDEIMFDFLEEIRIEILTRAFNGKKFATISVWENEWPMDEVQTLIQFFRNRGYDVKFANEEMIIRW